MLKDLEKILALVGDRQKLADSLLKMAQNRFGGDHGFILELEETTGGLRELASFGKVEEMLNQDMRIFAQYAGHHPLEKESVIIAPDAKDLKKLSARKSVRRDMTKGVLLFPLASGDQAVGVIYLGEKKKGKLEIDNLELEEVQELGHLYGRVFGIDRTFQRITLQNRALQNEIKQEATFDSLVGTSDAIVRVRRALELVAETDIPVTLIGEPGTKKELAGEAVHNHSPRRRKPIVILPLAELPTDMIGAFLFGKATGTRGVSARARQGALRDVKGGTLVLQDIENLSLDLQDKLLHAMENGTTSVDGGGEDYLVDFRLVCTTTKNPRELFDKNDLSKEFYLKTSIFPIILPPLRDRVEDLPILVESMVQESMAVFGKQISGISSEVYDFLGTWGWDNNYSELEKEIRQAVLRTPDQSLLIPAMLSRPIISRQQPSVVDAGEGTLKQRVASIEKRMIMDALEKNNHNQSLTADQLGLSRQALINKLHRYGIETGRKYKRMMKEIAARAEIDD